MRRAGIVCLLLAGGCFYFGPIEDAPPPPEQAPVIKETLPPTRSAIAEPDPGNPNSCAINIGLPQVEDPNGVPLVGRVFLNDGNSAVLDAFDATSLPLEVGSTTDFQLSPISTEAPTLLQLPPLRIDLLMARAYLALPSEVSAVNFIEIVVSDGFNDANFPADPNAYRDPASGKSTASAFWTIDLSQCASALL